MSGKLRSYLHRVRKDMRYNDVRPDCGVVQHVQVNAHGQVVLSGEK